MPSGFIGERFARLPFVLYVALSLSTGFAWRS